MVSETILIADSGSTKTHWCFIQPTGEVVHEYFSGGINPFFQSTDDILTSLKQELTGDIPKITDIYFYGAGCANSEKNEIVAKALKEFFACSKVNINSDLLGAARSLCQNDEGIVCILGTGSNSCYYDGKQIASNVSPLGFIIGDEGSGAVLGKLLIGDILKKQLPKSIIDLFYKEYNTTQADILNCIYKMPFPNRYLAQYSRFLSQNIHIKELENLVIKSFNDFIRRNLLQYDRSDSLNINFVGSIAHHFKPQLTTALEQNKLNIGTIIQSPMYGLIHYHQSKPSL